MTSQEEFISGHTNDKEKYLTQWNAHIGQLIYLGSPLIDSSQGDNGLARYAELLEIKERLLELVQIAADQEFK